MKVHISGYRGLNLYNKINDYKNNNKIKSYNETENILIKKGLEAREC